MITVGRNPKIKSKWAILSDGQLLPGPDGNPSKFAYFTSKKMAEAAIRDGYHIIRPRLISGNGGFVRMDGVK